MQDLIYQQFLVRQHAEGMALARESDVLELAPLHLSLPCAYRATFHACTLVRDFAGEVREAKPFVVGIRFPPDYLRHAQPARVVTLLEPLNVWHPNVSFLAPFICLGHLPAGTGLVEILYQVHDLFTFRKVTMREDDALNPLACAWARTHEERFPFRRDARPLKRPAGAAIVAQEIHS